jgi:hypothetical protein
LASDLVQVHLALFVQGGSPKEHSIVIAWTERLALFPLAADRIARALTRGADLAAFFAANSTQTLCHSKESFTRIRAGR